MSAGDRRSFGLKFILVCVLAGIMSLPALFVFALIYDRNSRAGQVVSEVGATFGGEQTFSGPMLAAPYSLTRTVPGADGRPTAEIERGWYVVYPETGEAEAALDVDVRGRGDLFQVRTYLAQVAVRAAFDLTREPTAAPAGAVIDWPRAKLVVGVSDPRGAQRADLAIGGAPPASLEPGPYDGVLGGAGPDGRPLQVLQAEAGGFAKPGERFEVRADVAFTGVESISLMAFAKNSKLTLAGDWADVAFSGAYPSPVVEAPEGRFARSWSVPFVARGAPGAGLAGSASLSGNQTVTARLLDPANPYQAVTRSLKYALLFIGVIFLAYFVLEATSDRRVHPAQYVLVGLAQLVFYLLLLSIAERLGFDLAFLIAAGATVTLIAAYAGAVFQSWARFLVSAAAFSGLYALIYLLMRLEDFALLAGSIAAFLAIAAVMFFTRKLDWYGLGLEARFPLRPGGPGPGPAGS